MSSIRKVVHPILLSLTLTSLPLLLAACGASSNVTDAANDTGTVAVELRLTDAVQLTTISYQISGNGFTKSGSADVAKSSVLKLKIGGIPKGQGYTIAVNAADAHDGGTSCSGSASFDVHAGQVAAASVHLQCRLPRTGSLLVTGDFNICPTADEMTVLPQEVSVGGLVQLTAGAADLDGAPAALTFAWTASRGTLTDSSLPNASFLCTEPGDAEVTLRVSDGDCEQVVLATVSCLAEDGSGGGAPLLVWNEIESSGGSPDDWVELYNGGTAVADLSGWVFRDNDDTHSYLIPAGTTLAPGAHLILENFGFGLGGGDSARLYELTGELVLSYTWTAHATTTYGRCPDADGELTTTVASSKGTANSCPVIAPPPDVQSAWPGASSVLAVDAANAFPTNLRGLHYEPAQSQGGAAVLWGALNAPSKLYRLVWNGAEWAPEAGDWSPGKLLNYPGGTGQPDTEGVTKAEWGVPGIYVSTERNNEASSTSRLSVLRFDETAAGATLVASHEWELTAQLPVVGANAGLEAITWVPDSYLQASGLWDELLGKLYSPADYSEHGTGLFIVGVEGTGSLHILALNHLTSAASIISTVTSGHPAIMALEFDRDTQALWAGCDDTCGNEVTLLEVDRNAGSPTLGRFVVRARFAPPEGLPSSNHEGLALLPESECAGGQKGIFWSDDANIAEHALRLGAVNCGPLF